MKGGWIFGGEILALEPAGDVRGRDEAEWPPHRKPETQSSHTAVEMRDASCVVAKPLPWASTDAAPPPPASFSCQPPSRPTSRAAAPRRSLAVLQLAVPGPSDTCRSLETPAETKPSSQAFPTAPSSVKPGATGSSCRRATTENDSAKVARQPEEAGGVWAGGAGSSARR